MLLRTLRKHGVRATWFVTLGPDNMGRHAWRMLRPAFALKMLRSRAATLYGWDILLRGTLWPGPRIGERLAAQLRDIEADGHEVGVHAWDHHRWQVGIDRLPDEALDAELHRACEQFNSVFQRAPECAAAPGWRCSERVLALPSSRAFRWRSDCRGRARPFLPLVGGAPLQQPQVPVDLPTFDEAAQPGARGDAQWNEQLLDRLSDGQPHVLTVHAESEGGAKARLFDDFLSRAAAQGAAFGTLGSWLASQPLGEPAALTAGHVAGREGWVCVGPVAKG
jgi:undecaprenyl phosphate-alpha-L-ara4FN deformylase